MFVPQLSLPSFPDTERTFIYAISLFFYTIAHIISSTSVPCLGNESSCHFLLSLTLSHVRTVSRSQVYRLWAPPYRTILDSDRRQNLGNDNSRSFSLFSAHIFSFRHAYIWIIFAEWSTDRRTNSMNGVTVVTDST